MERGGTRASQARSSSGPKRVKAGGFRQPPAKYRAFIASVIDALHVPLSEIARLTDRQLIEIYNHPRDKEGRIKEPPEPLPGASATPSLDRDLTLLAVVAANMRMPAEKYAALRKQLEEKWAAKKAEGDSPNG